MLEEDDDNVVYDDGFDQCHEDEPVEVFIEEARLIEPGTKKKMQSDH